ncbi:DnaJ domain-containing protein [Halobium salinum]|uniref:DnaJ domain-containing protein n=1 Tax=Halobium salinum TaxID=1364940 RepID=A0ABD5PGW3_9EURY|nr:DnaJ domain-containing protein [Halobium salinum]
MHEDFYELLGVESEATRDELKRAYREAAREYHPDVNDDDRAGAQFKAVRRAYDVLRDEDERADYDEMGHETYVRKRLGGLPSTSPKRSGGSDGGRSGTASRSTSRSSRDSRDGARGATAGSASDTSSTSSASAGSSNSSASNSSTRSETDGRSHPSREERARHRARRSTTAGRAGGSERVGRSSDTARGGSTRRAYEHRTDQVEEATTATPDRTAALRVRWLAVLAGTLAYLAGVARYVLSSADALAAYVRGVATTPAVASLTADAGLTGSVAFVREAVATPSADLLFPVGVVALPLVLALTVAQYGRGKAWLYVVAALAPVALPAAAGAPTATTLSAVVLLALPVVAAGVFLGDVGRYLLAAGRTDGATDRR